MPEETLGSLLGALYRRRLTIVLVLVGSLLAGTFYARLVGPDYVAAASVMIPNDPVGISLSTEGGNLPKGPLLPDLSDDARVGALGIFASGAVYDRMAEEHPDYDPRALRKAIRGNIDRGGNIQVLAYAPTPELAAELANDYAEAFQDELEEITLASLRRSFEAFVREEPLAEQRYREAHQALVDYLASIDTVDLDNETAQLLTERRKVEEQLLQLELRRVKDQAERPVLEAALAERPEMLTSLRKFQRNDAFDKLLARARDLSAQLAVARLEYRDVHPEIQRLQRELEVVQREAEELAEEQMRLDSEVTTRDAQVTEWMRRLAAMDVVEASYDAQRAVWAQRIAEIEPRLQRVPSYRAEVAERQSQLASARSYWEKVASRRSELDFHVRAGLDFSVMTDAMRARPERAKQVPTTAGLYLFCTIAGIAGGLFLALSLELLARMRASRPF